MPTSWFYPGSVSQYAEVEEHIPWVDTDNFFNLRNPIGAFTPLTQPLLHISIAPGRDYRMKTWYLTMSQFNAQRLPETITGIEVELNMNRGGRITDDTIQLMYNNEFIGANRGNEYLDPDKFYGGSDDLWDFNLTQTMITDSTFGIGVRFQSHPYWPHNEYPRISYIRFRVY